jgi:hypothetical protein
MKKTWPGSFSVAGALLAIAMYPSRAKELWAVIDPFLIGMAVSAFGCGIWECFRQAVEALSQRGADSDVVNLKDK